MFNQASFVRILCTLLDSQVSPHLGNSRKDFFPDGKHFRCASFPFGKQRLDQKVHNWFPKWKTRDIPNRKHKIDFCAVFPLFRGQMGGGHSRLK